MLHICDQADRASVKDPIFAAIDKHITATMEMIRMDCVSLEPGAPAPRALAGKPLDQTLLGPSSAAWSRSPGERGWVVFVTSDGGHTAPPRDGRVRSAKVLRMELSQ